MDIKIIYMKNRNLYIETFGCQMNANDSERITSMLRPLGYEVSSDVLAADLVLYNTCTVRGGPEEKLYQHLANLKNLKRKNPGVLIGVGGCGHSRRGRSCSIPIPGSILFSAPTIFISFLI